MPYPITSPDGAAWSIDAVATPDGVALVMCFELAGVPTTIALGMDRPDSRQLARKILATGGDAMERTFEGAGVDAGRR